MRRSPTLSEPTQPVLVPVAPIRLFPCDANGPWASGRLLVAMFAATIVLPIVTVPCELPMPPPLEALLPLTVTLVSWVSPGVA